MSSIITHGDIIATTNREKVNLFNSYFSSAFQPKSDRNCFELSDAFESVMQISEIQIETNEVHECLRTLNTTKACGPDEIPARILKECALEISPSLCSLFNTSLKAGKVPDEWKKSNITPVHKKDSRENVSNYRPISLLSIISKVMERCIHNRVYPILSALINKTQHGFLKKRSCVTQLLSVLHDIGKNLDNNKQVDLIYLDFSKAFDSVDHAILYQKLYAHGLRGSILLWFKDYLTDRCQRVVLDNVASEWSPVTSGVPQGSILGPLLFTIFINTLPDSLSPGSQAAFYADDSKVFQPITSLVDSMALQQDLNNLEVWSSKNSIQFNPSKCKILTVTRKRNPITFSYKLTSNDLVRCDEERDLGITITYNLKWDSHITKI